MIEVNMQQAWLGPPWKKRLVTVEPELIATKRNQLPLLKGSFVGILGVFESPINVSDLGCTTECRCRDKANRSRRHALKRYHNQILIKPPNVKHLRM